MFHANVSRVILLKKIRPKMTVCFTCLLILKIFHWQIKIYVSAGINWFRFYNSIFEICDYFCQTSLQATILLLHLKELTSSSTSPKSLTQAQPSLKSYKANTPSELRQKHLTERRISTYLKTKFNFIGLWPTAF